MSHIFLLLCMFFCYKVDNWEVFSLVLMATKLLADPLNSVRLGFNNWLR